MGGGLLSGFANNLDFFQRVITFETLWYVLKNINISSDKVLSLLIMSITQRLNLSN